MKRAICLTLLLCQVVLAGDLKLSYRLIGKEVAISHAVKEGKNYSLIRVSLTTGYTDVCAAYSSSSNGVVTIKVDPRKPSDEDQPPHTGQCYFYVVEY